MLLDQLNVKVLLRGQPRKAEDCNMKKLNLYLQSFRLKEVRKTFVLD
jgi:hypothetical protein